MIISNNFMKGFYYMKQPSTIKIDDIEYIRADSVESYEKAQDLEGMEYKIVRTRSAGVFAGYIEDEDGQEVIMVNARRLWYWSGAASLSQLAEDGVSKPIECKFPKEVRRIKLLEAIEILDCTEKARKSIKSVSEWSA